MKYAYYPGCTLHSTAREYDRSLRAVCEKVGIELEEVTNWICCGSTPAHTTSRLLSLALPLKNLAEIEKSGFRDEYEAYIKEKRCPAGVCKALISYFIQPAKKERR